MTTDKHTELDSLFPEKRVGTLLADSGSNIVAALTVVLSATLVFADVSFAAFGTVAYTSTLLVLLVATYLMYFSLEDVGERAGEATDEARAILARYDEVKSKIRPDSIGALRDFLRKYTEDELAFRRERILASGGLTERDLEDFLAGAKFTREEVRILRKAKRARAAAITPATLLSGTQGSSEGELHNPERHKIIALSLRLIPTTVCMLFTVSLVLTAKDGLTPSTVLDGIFKLSALPLSGLRGYRAGFIFARHTRTAWCEVKTRLLEAFLANSAEKVPPDKLSQGLTA